MKQATIECTEDNRDEIYNFLSSLTTKGEHVNIEDMRGPLGGALLESMGGPHQPGAPINLNNIKLAT